MWEREGREEEEEDQHRGSFSDRAKGRKSV